MRRRTLAGIVLVLFSIIFLTPHYSIADLEWSVKKQLKLDAAPLEVAPSADGKWIYVLTTGEILVYSVFEDKVVNRIPVDKTVDRLSYSAPDNTLLVSSSREKTLKIIQLEAIHHFSLEGLPFEGPKNAPVTIVVFSDYQ